MREHSRSHLWFHAALVVAIAAVFGLNAIGVAVPSVVTYLIVLACPVMMLSMMISMNRAGHDDRQETGESVAAGGPR